MVGRGGIGASSLGFLELTCSGDKQTYKQTCLQGLPFQIKVMNREVLTRCLLLLRRWLQNEKVIFISVIIVCIIPTQKSIVVIIHCIL